MSHHLSMSELEYRRICCISRLKNMWQRTVQPLELRSRHSPSLRSVEQLGHCLAVCFVLDRRLNPFGAFVAVQGLDKTDPGGLQEAMTTNGEAGCKTDPLQLRWRLGMQDVQHQQLQFPNRVRTRPPGAGRSSQWFQTAFRAP